MKRALTLTVTIGLLGALGCGQLQQRPQPVVVIHDGGAPVSSEQGAQQSGGGTSSTDSDLKKLKEFVDLYFDNGTIDRQGLDNLLTKYKDRIGPFLAGAKITQKELVDLLFKFDANQDGKLTLDEIQGGIAKRIPILRWIDSNEEKVTAEELSARIGREYPDASPASRDALARTLARFDEPWAGGNGDGFVTRSELATAGIILGVLAQTDFSQPIDEPMAAELMDMKMHQQLILRHDLKKSWHELSASDTTLEWMQLGLRFYLVDKLTHDLNADGLVPDVGQAFMIRRWGIAGAKDWSLLRKLSDNKLFGGDADGTLNDIESFGLLSDLDYAQAFVQALGGDVSAKLFAQAPARAQLLGNLQLLYPTVGRDLFGSGSSPRPEFWDGVRMFDLAEDGGNGDGKIDAGELSLALDYARVTEQLFAQYDKNHDGLLSKNEAAPMFASLGYTDRRVVDAFFADMALDGKGSKVWAKIKAFFSGREQIDELSPYEFHRRLLKILPTFLKENKK